MLPFLYFFYTLLPNTSHPRSWLPGGSCEPQCPFVTGITAVPPLLPALSHNHSFIHSAARTFRVNNSGSDLSSPPHLQPYTKPFSGRPARPRMTCPTREAGEAVRPRSGIIYPLLLRAQRPDTHVAIDAALPEAATIGRQDLPSTVLEIGTTSQPQPEPSTRRRASRKPSRKRRRNHSAGVFRPPKRSPPHGHWCE